ncbi:MAG: D-aminoacyl-tRNA deacylase [Vicingaceae bacterium]
MRVVIQRVKHAKVEVSENTVGEIDHGLLVFVGVEEADEMEDVEWLSQKIANMRIFNDEEGNMNLGIKAVGGDILAVSQFTLHAATKKGNRPSFMRAASPEQAEKLYEQFKLQLGALMGKPIQCGVFGADMQVSLLNDGPVTITMDSRNRE